MSKVFSICFVYKKIKIDAIFPETEMYNEWQDNFLENGWIDYNV